MTTNYKKKSISSIHSNDGRMDHKPRRMSVGSFYWAMIDSMIEEGDRGREMTASLDNNTVAGGDNADKGKDDVYTVSMTGGYDNKGFKGDGDNGWPGKPPNKEITDEEASSQGKFKLSTKEKWRILKNVSCISCAFMIQFTAFQGTANLQSSINAKDGLGTVSLCAIYAALVVSCIFVPTFLIKRLTVKWTLCISLLCYAPYIGSQFYPRFYTLVPAGVLLGIGAAPMWASKATYLTQVAGVYAKLTDQAVDGIIVRFFGFFFLAWQTSELWGNLISSLVLSNPHGGGGASTNSAGNISYTRCGSEFCTAVGNENDNLARPDDKEIYEISAIYLACIFSAVLLIAVSVDPLSRYGEKQRRNSGVELTGLQLLSATAYQLKKPYQQLLIPITVWIGMEQAFIGADFTQAFVSCALGISSVGYVMISFGVVNAICCLLFGSVMKYIGRSPIMIFGAVVHTALQVWLLIWRPHPDNPIIFFIAAGMWGVGDAVWQTQVNGLYGTLFRRNKEPAFSNYRLWESVGFVITYAYSTHICAAMKLYIQLTILISGFLMYGMVEVHHMRKVRRQKEKEKRAAELEAANKAAIQEPEETDDEKDDIDDEIIVTHL
ncbi:UNC93-like protein isoform X1 [Tribolium castaneum]|nr:PREDICTED: UNC93-like protein isoform X1 [Tribolium castaneum]|eukprot:XP_015833676.1 PREDICTED: UNC93-like protein isoform X1 [Tribolium castaneum]